MELSFAAFVNRLTVLQVLLCAVVGSAMMSENSTWCNVTTTSRTIPILCDVTLTRCDQRIMRMSLFSPPINNLQVSLEMLLDKMSDLYLNSLATIRWNLPDDSESLKGFLVHLQTLDGSDDKCYLLSIPQMAVADNPEFGLYLPLEPNIYAVRVHSRVESSLIHGSPYTVPSRTIIVKERREVYRNIPAFWITDLVVLSNSCSSSVLVSFELAPSTYDFSVYIVELLRGIAVLRKELLHVVNGQRQGTVLFGNISSGNYTVKVYPENTDAKDPLLCRCQCGGLQATLCLGKTCPTFECVAIESNIVTINNVNAGDCCLTIDDSFLPTKIAAVVFGCFLAIGLIALIAWILLRPKHIDISVHSFEKQDVLLLYLSDHSHHRTVIHHLLHFLNCHCNCSVRTMHDDAHIISQNPFRYVQNACNGKSRRILLINSDGLATGSSSMSYDPLDSMVQMFLGYLHPLGINEKLTLARFEYTEINDVAEQIDYRQHEYLLTKEMELLILHIHGFERRKGRCVYHIRDIQRKFNNSPEGKRLSEAVSTRFTSQAVSDSTNQAQETRYERRFNDSPEGNGLYESLRFTSQVVSDSTDQHQGTRYLGSETANNNNQTWDSVVDREPIDELYVADQADELELRHGLLVPPSDSSSLGSDSETQLWSNEINADFDSNNN